MGSEATAHGLGYRLTNDIDVVLDLYPATSARLVRPIVEPDFVVTDLLRVDGWWLGSAIAR